MFVLLDQLLTFFRLVVVYAGYCLFDVIGVCVWVYLDVEWFLGKPEVFEEDSELFFVYFVSFQLESLFN